MYASAMKYCGMMELCGIGYPTNKPIDYQWPEILEQVKAQKAGALIAVTRGFKPEEADFCKTQGFAAMYQFKSPRTGTISTVWIKDFTLEGSACTKIPESIPWTGNPPEQAPPVRAPAALRPWTLDTLLAPPMDAGPLRANAIDMESTRLYPSTVAMVSSPEPDDPPL